MTIDMRPQLSEPYRKDLIKELDKCCSISNDYANLSSSLLLQFKARAEALEGGIQFSSETERINYLAETIAIMEQSNEYASLCKGLINKGNEIASKLGLR